VNRFSLLARKHGFDVLIVLAAIASTLEVALQRDSTRAPQTTPWFAVPATALIVLPLLGRRRFPFLAPVLVWLLAAGLSFVDGRLVGFTASVSVVGGIAAFLLGNLRADVQARIGLAVVVGCAAIVVYNTPDYARGELVFIPLLFALGWLAGFALRERAEQAEAAEVRARQAEQEREAAMRIAVAEERARIARELHDIVAHAVSVMVLQVGAVRHKLPAELTENVNALKDVEHAGRTALTEMRRLLGAMRRAGDEVELVPQPGLDNLGVLAEEVGRAGLPVRLHVEGEMSPLPPAVDLSAYRIVQEGLTNARKHAPGTAVRVDIGGAPGSGLTIDIRNPWPVGAPAAIIPGTGTGLVGLAERTTLAGGRLTHGRTPQDDFALTAWLPWPS
jgi:signal transduction histidine kinase